MNISIEITPNSSGAYSSFEVFKAEGPVKSNSDFKNIAKIEKETETVQVGELEPNKVYSIGILANDGKQSGGILMEHTFTTAAEKDGNMFSLCGLCPVICALLDLF